MSIFTLCRPLLASSVLSAFLQQSSFLKPTTLLSMKLILRFLMWETLEVTFLEQYLQSQLFWDPRLQIILHLRQQKPPQLSLAFLTCFTIFYHLSSKYPTVSILSIYFIYLSIYYWSGSLKNFNKIPL